MHSSVDELGPHAREFCRFDVRSPHLRPARAQRANHGAYVVPHFVHVDDERWRQEARRHAAGDGVFVNGEMSEPRFGGRFRGCAALFSAHSVAFGDRAHPRRRFTLSAASVSSSSMNAASSEWSSQSQSKGTETEHCFVGWPVFVRCISRRVAWVSETAVVAGTAAAAAAAAAVERNARDASRSPTVRFKRRTMSSRWVSHSCIPPPPRPSTDIVAAAHHSRVTRTVCPLTMRRTCIATRRPRLRKEEAIRCR